MGRITYVDKDRLEISFSSIVFNVKTLNHKFGTLRSFAEKFDLGGVTNGKLFYLSKHQESPNAQYQKMERRFLPLGLIKGEDYTFIFQHPLADIPYENPSCIGVNWLGSEITAKGCFLWYDDIGSKSANMNTSPLLRSSIPESLKGERQLSFKVFDRTDPKPTLPEKLFKEVSYEKFVIPEKDCLPVFIATHLGVFPEEIIPEALEGQEVAFMYGSLHTGSVTIFRVLSGTRKKIKQIFL